jgi:hypothetical protein
MKRSSVIIALVFTAFTSGCSSRHTPLEPINMSLDGGARESEKVPYVDPGLPSGDLEKASADERDRFMKLQQERMKKQQDEVDDLRRQKFQDDYYKSRYPSESR